MVTSGVRRTHPPPSSSRRSSVGSIPKTVKIRSGVRRTRHKPIKPPFNLPGSHPKTVETSSGSEDPGDTSPALIRPPENPDLIYATQSCSEERECTAPFEQCPFWCLSMNVRAASGIRRDHPRFIGPCPSSGRGTSTSVSETSEIRRSHRRRVGPRLNPGWNPSVKLRHGSKLRRAHHRALASHRSASRPSVRNQRPVQAPKSSSATNHLDLQPRVEPSRELPSRIKPPKRPSTKHRLAFRRRGTFLQASAHFKDPKNPSMKHRPAIGTRGAFLQASEPHPSSEEPFNETSAHDPAPRGLPSSIRPASSLRRDHQQVVNPLSSSGWNLPPSLRLSQGSEDPVNKTSACHRDPRSHPEGVRVASSLRRDRQRNIDPRSDSAGPSAECQARVEPPKRSSASHRPAFQLRVEPSSKLQHISRIRRTRP
jgi:hypothetical protein